MSAIFLTEDDVAWLLDMETREVLWDAETRRIHEVPDDFVPTMQNVSNFYAEETREDVNQDIARFHQQRVDDD